MCSLFRFNLTDHVKLITISTKLHSEFLVNTVKYLAAKTNQGAGGNQNIVLRRDLIILTLATKVTLNNLLMMFYIFMIKLNK